MREKYKVQIKMLLVLLFVLVSAVALFSKINELEFKHVVGIFMLGVAFIGINNIIFKKKTMEEQEWSYSELEKEIIKDFKRRRVDMIRENWGFHEQEKEAIAKMYQEEHDLLMQALKKHGIEFDIEQEQKRRFKTLSVEIQNLPHGGQVKRFYYNDGSIDGILLLEYDVQNGYNFKLSSLIGKLSEKGAEEMREQIGDLRKEWEE